VYPAVILVYFISAAVIILTSLALNSKFRCHITKLEGLVYCVEFYNRIKLGYLARLVGYLKINILGVFVKHLRKATLILCPFEWNSATFTGRIFVGLIFVITIKSCRQVLILVKVGQATETSNIVGRTLLIPVRFWSI